MNHRFDAVVAGGGHNGLVAATLLARAGRSVLVLERGNRLGGAAVSEEVFPGIGARISRYAYLVSLFPRGLAEQLGLGLSLAPRSVSSYTPRGETGLLVPGGEPPGWPELYAMLRRVAGRVFPTLTEPLRSRDAFQAVVGDDAAWEALFETPLSELLERSLPDDLSRGVALTDGLIGTFAPADDPQLRQNRCFLYHVIGNGTGRWDVPRGGMGAVSEALGRAAKAADVRIRTGAPVDAIETDGERAEVICADGNRYECADVLAGVAPARLDEMLGVGAQVPAPEGSQLKLNMLLRRLPRLRDPAVTPRQAFTGTFHVNEGYEQLAEAFAQADGGRIPSLPPCEAYCHSLTDPSILTAELRDQGVHTLTLFGLHMPTRLFAEDHDAAKAAAVEATLASVDSVLAEPLEDCLLRDPDGRPCLEASTPVEIEAELGMPGGHIFHRDLSWPFAESDQDVGRWGVETSRANVWLCGAGARRGGGVSGIPGHNAARAVLERRRRA